MKKVILIFLTLILLFSGIDKVFSQEWEVFNYNDYYNDSVISRYKEVLELSNGNILVSSFTQHKNNIGEFCSGVPSLVLISHDGIEIGKNDYFKPGMCVLSYPYVFENNGEMYMLNSYNPDHDPYSDNHFKNYNEPPTESIIGLYKLDEMLNVHKRYEHFIPIDTFEQRDETWYQTPYLSGCINIYSAFEDNGIITGSYTKEVSYSEVPRGNDSVFFFKMDFEGNLLLNKGYEVLINENRSNCFRQQMVKGDNGYIVYYRYSPLPSYHSRVEYYDNDFNYIDTKHIRMPEHDVNKDRSFRDHCVIRSNNNTTYVSTISRSLKNPLMDDDIRLYEFNDDLNNSGEVLPVIRYIERGTPELDRPSYRSLDMTDDGNIFFAYSLNVGSVGHGDSWAVIEMLDANLDTISTLFYDIGEQMHTTVLCIKATDDDGLLLITKSKDLKNTNNRWTTVSKFPASAFVSIEEAHAHNLKVAVAYPNPGGDVMNIRTSLRNCTLQVYDMQGRMVHQQEITDDVTSVDASSWSSGTYVWELGTENGSGILESGKWVK